MTSPSGAPPTSATPPVSEWTTTQRSLVVVVVGLGLLMIGSIVAMFGRIVYLASLPPVTPNARPALATTAALPSEPKRLWSLPLPKGAQIKHTSLEGGRLLVHYGRPSGPDAIAILDLASGALIGEVQLDVASEPSTPKP